MTTATEVNPEAPHGYGGDGAPLAPYGYKADGTPRKDGRGRPSGGGEGPRTAAAPKRRAAKKKPAAGKRSQAETREMLVSLADMVTMPLAGAARAPLVRKRLGDGQAMALSGDAVIVQSFAPHLADGLISLSQTKPGVLNFLDQLEDKAPYLMLAQVGGQMAKALISNHLSPDARLANAGQTMAAIRAAQLAEEIERQAADLGIPTEVPVPEPEPEHGMAA